MFQIPTGRSKLLVDAISKLEAAWPRHLPLSVSAQLELVLARRTRCPQKVGSAYPI